MLGLPTGLSVGWRLLPYLGSALAAGLLVWGIHHHGYSAGQAEVQARWDQRQREDQAALQAVKDEYARREALHQAATTRITHELAEAEKAHDVALADQRTDFERRLRSSEQRAALYKRQAGSDTAQCGSLASHAARLDRSLEDGRRVVANLRRTLELRDEQLRQLGRQLTTDRALITDTTPSPSTSSAQATDGPR